MKPRVRFAPSPTGYLHIGGARTALFNWLFARRHGGTFVLRIEDTDQGRSTPESLAAILEGLKWLGIDWDEGPGVGGPFPPYFQMEKLQRYQALAEQLIAEGKAYRDYSTEEETQKARADFAASKGFTGENGLLELRKAGFKFKSPWRDSAAVQDKPHVVRFKMPDLEGSFGFDDLVLGRIDKPFDDLDDFVMIRSDGIPLYNYGCVVDDHDMQITHVGRGQEHINSTFPQLMLYRALGWEPPLFAHLPLILGPDREKLSKRKHPEADVMTHKRAGMLPHALLNFVARLGWSHGNDEYFTLEQLISYFDFEHVGKSSGVWNPEKLLAINEHWIKNSEVAKVAEATLPFLHAAGVTEAVVDARLEKGISAFRTRAKTLVEMANSLKPYYAKGVTLDAAAAAKHLTPEGKVMLARAKALLEAMPSWTAAALDPIVDSIATETGAKKGAIAQPIRVAVTGTTVSPGIGDTLELLGREEALARIGAALA
jgi:glutamyl-tRNA synthetase